MINKFFIRNLNVNDNTKIIISPKALAIQQISTPKRELIEKQSSKKYSQFNSTNFQTEYEIEKLFLKGNISQFLESSISIRKEINYKNGDKYEGETLNEKKHGNGVFQYNGNNMYSGKFKHDMQEGFGDAVYSDGSSFKGHFLCGKRHGLGKYDFNNRDTFYGFWADGNMNGVGIYSFADGARFEGEVSNNIFCGFGHMNQANGDLYYGDFENGKPHGNGVYFYAEKNERFEGEFQDGKIWGYGTHYYSDDHYLKYIEGYFENGMKVDYAILTFKNNTIINGKYEKNKLIDGTIFFINGDIYQGQIKNCKMEGKGKLIYHNSDQYIGSFIKNKKEGKGIYIFSSGPYFEGEFKHDILYGEAVYTFKDERINGKFINGEFYENSSNILSNLKITKISTNISVFDNFNNK